MMMMMTGVERVPTDKRPLFDSRFTPRHRRREENTYHPFKMNRNIVVKSIKTGFSAELPTDMDNPGYWFDDSKVGLERVGRYISKQEWQELAHGANAAYKTHAATSNGFVMKLLFGTFGICFCPLMCYGCFVDVEGNVNADIEKLPVAQKLKGRGITLHFRPKRGKFDMGGMDCAISAKTPALPPVSDTK